MITTITVERREPFAEGHEFPITGAYETLMGQTFGEVNPKDPLNQTIVNLDAVPKNSRGKVQYQTDLCILKPVDMRRGNGKIIFEPPNRGNKRILTFLNDAPESNNPATFEHAGNAFLMRQGYTIVWAGWQGDVCPGERRLTMEVPIATRKGKEIVALTRTEMVATEEGIFSQPLSGDERSKSYETAITDKAKCALTVREKSYESRRPVPTEDWEFGIGEWNRDTGKLDIKPSTTDLCILSGFKPGSIYEFIYPAKNPTVLGLGFAAVRDLVSFLRYEMEDQEAKRNPLFATPHAAVIRRAYAWGRSQSGRYLRDFVYHGFNEDELYRKVFDAMAPHAGGGGRLYFNYEFARPVTSSQQHTDQPDPELFPFAYSVSEDLQSGRKDGILKRPKTDPYVIHTQTSTEYWQKRGCLAHTDGKGKDIRIPDKVRIYAIASAQHNMPFGTKSEKRQSQQLINPLPVGDALRALFVAMDRWVCDGTQPTPSQIPRVGDRTLVPSSRESTGFPTIPGVRYNGLYNRQLFIDYGSEIEWGRITRHPPSPIGMDAYIILVPKVDDDGNDIAGIRLPTIRVPLATHTGWNLQSEALSENELCGLLGSYIPFARTKEERVKTGDPRPSIGERYNDHQDYLLKIIVECRSMVEEKLLLPEDAERIITEAEQARDLFQE